MVAPTDAKAASVQVAHKKQIYSLSWNCTGDKLATGSTDTTIRVWRFHSNTGKLSDKHEAELKGHSEPVSSVAFHPDQPDILVSASDKSVRFWDTKNPSKPTATVSGILQTQCLAWSPSGKEVAVSTLDGHLCIIDTRKYKVTKTSQVGNEVNGLAWHRNGKILFFGTSDGTFEVVQYPSLEPLWQLQGHTSSCYCLAASSNSKYVATGGADALLALWSLDSMVCSSSCCRPDNPVRSIGFSNDSQHLAYATTYDPFIDILDCATGEVVCRVLGALRDSKDDVKLGVALVAWNPKRAVLAFSGDDKDRADKEKADRNGGYGRDSLVREHQGLIGICAPFAK